MYKFSLQIFPVMNCLVIMVLCTLMRREFILCRNCDRDELSVLRALASSVQQVMLSLSNSVVNWRNLSCELDV